jgi:hypothetical protein
MTSAVDNNTFVLTVEIQAAVSGYEGTVLDALGIVGWATGKHLICPLPDHDDTHPSWRWDPEKRRAICTCGSHNIFRIVQGIEKLDFATAKLRVAEILKRPDLIRERNPGCTVAAYAETKRLPVEFLAGLGVREVTGRFGKPELEIPYRDRAGNTITTRRRVKLAGKRHTFSEKGSKASLYGLDRIGDAKDAGFALLVEGESDCQTAWLNGFPAFGLPGTTAFKAERDGLILADVPVIYAVVEPDDAGAGLAQKLARSSLAPKTRLVRFENDIKDPSALWLACDADPVAFKTAMQAALDRAEPCPVTDAIQAPLDALIKRFNELYAVVNEAGKVVVFEQVLDPSVNRYRIDRFTFADFKKLYQNEPLTVTFVGADNKPKSITKTAAEWWLNHRDRRQYLGGVVCDPTEKAPVSYWNLWSGFGVKPAPGVWSLMREHIRKVICAGNPKHDDYLMNWLARLFQHPEERAEVAIVMRGVEGVGKGLLGRLVARAFGQHGMQISSSAHLVGNFNAHLRDLIVLFADEAFFAGDRQHEGRLKALITEETLTIEGKYQNVVNVRNMLHIIMASNADWVIPASLKARRWFMLDVADNRQGDFAYFKAIVEQMDNGGLAAMLQELLHRDISNFNPRDVPKTDALAGQQLYSLDSLHQLWLVVLTRGYVYRSKRGAQVFRDWRDFVTTELLLRSYLQWCDENRLNRRQSISDLGKFMSQLYPWARPQASHPTDEIDVIDVDPVEKHGNWLEEHAVVWKEHKPGYTVGTLEEARVAFTTICNVPTEWGLQPGGQGD